MRLSTKLYTYRLLDTKEINLIINQDFPNYTYDIFKLKPRLWYKYRPLVDKTHLHDQHNDYLQNYVLHIEQNIR